MSSETIGQEVPRPTNEIVFDVLFGVAMPIACLIFDPIVFKNHGMFERYALAAYLLIATAILALILWNWLREPGAFLAGMFFAEGLFALLLGLALFPFSFIGKFFFGIGFLGYTPLFTSFVFFRNARRAWHSARQLPKERALFAAMGFIMVLAEPAMVHLGWEWKKANLPAMQSARTKASVEA